MKILHICSNFDKFFLNFMQTQIQNNINIKVFYFRAKERGFPEVKAPYLDIRLNYSQWDRAFFLKKQKKVWKDFLNIYELQNFDILHAHTLFSNGYIAYKAKKKFGKPYIVAVRSVDINTFFKYRPYLRVLGKNILKEAETIVFLSPIAKDEFYRKYFSNSEREILEEKTVILPNGIDQYYFNNKYSVKRNIRDKSNINIITVGFVSKRKNQINVAKAINTLNIKSDLNLSYTVIGEVLDKKIQSKLQKYEFVEYVPFLSKEELVKKYRESDLFVLASHAETFGLTYAEALSQGLPIIYTEKQGFDGQFEDGYIGYKVKSNNVSDIAYKIQMLINDADVLADNTIKAVEKFKWNNIIKSYIDIYQAIIKRSDSEHD